MPLGPVIKLAQRAVSHTRWALRDPRHFLEHLDNKRHPEKRHQRHLGFETMPPLQVQVGSSDEARPSLNVLLPKLGQGHLTGGPNTAVQFAAMLSMSGIPVRIVVVDEALPADMAALLGHVKVLVGVETELPNLTFASTFDAEKPAQIGRRDMFLATSWTTAYRLKNVLGRMAIPEFIYLIQDFEPSFYPWSGSYAQALETYGMSYHALVNEQFLADYLISTGAGQFADASSQMNVSVFEPAVDERFFYPVKRSGDTRQLLFYARPANPRNLFGLGFEALRLAASATVFANADWRFVAIGDSSLESMPLGGGRMLEPAPWLSYTEYARLIRESDLLLCPMLSPHTSYPVLEMAACRGISVTNTFGPKTQARLNTMSAGIVAGAPTIEGLRDAILAATSIDRQATGGPDRLPGDWTTALAHSVQAIRQTILEHFAKAGA